MKITSMRPTQRSEKRRMSSLARTCRQKRTIPPGVVWTGAGRRFRQRRTKEIGPQKNPSSHPERQNKKIHPPGIIPAEFFTRHAFDHLVDNEIMQPRWVLRDDGQVPGERKQNKHNKRCRRKQAGARSSGAHEGECKHRRHRASSPEGLWSERRNQKPPRTPSASGRRPRRGALSRTPERPRSPRRSGTYRWSSRWPAANGSAAVAKHQPGSQRLAALPSPRRGQFDDEQDGQQGKKREKQARAPGVHPEQAVTGRSHPIGEDRLGQVRPALKLGHEPVAGAIKLACRLGVAPFIGFGQRARAGEGKRDEQKEKQPGRARGIS